MEGYTSADYALSVFGKYLSHVHVKNARPVGEGGRVPPGRRFMMKWGTLSKGDLDWEYIIKKLRNLDFGGFLSLEALDGRDSEAKLSEDIVHLQSLLKKQ